MDVSPEQFLEHSCALDEAEEGARSLAELSDLMGLSRERVRQIEQRALRKLGMTKDMLELGQYSRGENVRKWQVLAGIREAKKARSKAKGMRRTQVEAAPKEIDLDLEGDNLDLDFV
jgi:hypothetical protein